MFAQHLFRDMTIMKKESSNENSPQLSPVLTSFYLANKPFSTTPAFSIILLLAYILLLQCTERCDIRNIDQIERPDTLSR
jgi:hypothetical protein